MAKGSEGLILDASVAKLLFLGTITERNLSPYPTITPSEAETLKMVIESVDRFMEGRDREYAEYDRHGAQPESYLQELRELGLFGLVIPESHGGIGFSNSAYSRVLQQTSRYDASTSLTIGAHSSIGMKGLLLFGNDEQKDRYLPKLATGECIAAFCLTEPGAGSDAASLKTSAVRDSEGNWVLNGEKIWITNGATAELFTVFARTDSPEGKISAFIVERSFTGLSNGPKEEKMGIRASATTTISFDNVKVPAANLLGEEGHGFKIAMAILNNGRTGLGGGCVGAMKASIARAVRHSAERKQFGKPIAEFGLIKEKLAEMTVRCFAAESVVNLVAHFIDSGVEDYSIEAAISKIYATESLWHVANEALQIAGGNGFMKEYPYERVVRDSRINMIFEGTNDILRLYVGLSGLREAGEYLKEIQRSVGSIFNDPIKGFGVLSRYASRRVSQLTSVGQQRLEFVHPTLRAEAAVYELAASRLGRASEELLRRYGKKVVDAQTQTKRVAEVAIDIFVGLSVLSRVSAAVEAVGERGARDELAIARLFTQSAKRRITASLRRLMKNEDAEAAGLADSVHASGGYRWDVI